MAKEESMTHLYHSMREFQKKDIDEKDFYEEYSKCFELNTKFAVNKPIPDLGDKDTPMD